MVIMERVIQFDNDYGILQTACPDSEKYTYTK